MGSSSWVKTITSPFKKACTIFNSPTRDHNKSQTRHDHQYDQYGMNLQCEVMACSYEDVQVMWSILDKSWSGERNPRS